MRSSSWGSPPREHPPRRRAPGSGRIARPTHSTPRRGSPESPSAPTPPPIPRRADDARRIATPNGGIHVHEHAHEHVHEDRHDGRNDDADGASPPAPRTGPSHSIPNSSWIVPSGHPPSAVSISCQPVRKAAWRAGRTSARSSRTVAGGRSRSCSWSEWLRASPGGKPGGSESCRRTRRARSNQRHACGSSSPSPRLRCSMARISLRNFSRIPARNAPERSAAAPPIWLRPFRSRSSLDTHPRTFPPSTSLSTRMLHHPIVRTHSPLKIGPGDPPSPDAPDSWSVSVRVYRIRARSDRNPNKFRTFCDPKSQEDRYSMI